jgi:hypothetical protein
MMMPHDSSFGNRVVPTQIVEPALLTMAVTGVSSLVEYVDGTENAPSLLVRRRLEHALQGRLGDLGEGRADLGLLRRRHPRGLDRRYPVSLMPRSSASRRSASSTVAAA